MPKLIVDVECGAKECGEACPFLAYYDGYHCLAFERTEDDVRGCPTRLPACLRAEADLTRLVEAARLALPFVLDGSDWQKNLEAALEPFEEGK